MTGILERFNFSLHFIECGDGTVRVWRSDWASDQFEVLSTQEFLCLQETGITLVEFLDD